MRITINTIPTLKRVNEKLSKIPRRIDKGLSALIKRTAFEIEGEAKKVTPVDTGRLRASIYTDIRPMFASIQPKTNYAIYVHDGTRYMKGRPFMTIAAEKVGDRVGRDLKITIKKAIKLK